MWPAAAVTRVGITIDVIIIAATDSPLTGKDKKSETREGKCLIKKEPGLTNAGVILTILYTEFKVYWFADYVVAVYTHACNGNSAYRCIFILYIYIGIFNAWSRLEFACAIFFLSLLPLAAIPISLIPHPFFVLEGFRYDVSAPCVGIGLHKPTILFSDQRSWKRQTLEASGPPSAYLSTGYTPGPRGKNIPFKLPAKQKASGHKEPIDYVSFFPLAGYVAPPRRLCRAEPSMLMLLLHRSRPTKT